MLGLGGESAGWARGNAEARWATWSWAMDKGGEVRAEGDFSFIFLSLFYFYLNLTIVFLNQRFKYI